VSYLTQQQFEEIEEAIGYHFCNRMLFSKPLFENPILMNRGQNNEVLEFLGDEVLGYVVTEKCPLGMDRSTKMRSSRVA